jgi:hypothetical protein
VGNFKLVRHGRWWPIGLAVAVAVIVGPATALAGVGQFGTTTPGGSWGCPPAGYKYGNKYTLPASGAVTKITAYMKGNGGAGSQKFKAMIYAADGAGGAPGTLLATSQEATVAGNAAPGAVDFPISPSVSLAPGDYWIAQLSGPDGAQACLSAGAAGLNNFNVNPYGSGPSNPFSSSGPIQTDANLWTLSATYETSVPAGGPTDKNQCKQDGWRGFTNPSFKNQGDCVSSFVHSTGHGGHG